MICLECDNESEFSEEEKEIIQEFKGMTLKVKTPVTICKKCGWYTIGNGQLDELVKRTKALYTLKKT